MGWRFRLAVILAALLGVAMPAVVLAETTQVTIGVGETTTRMSGSTSPSAAVTISSDGATVGSTTADAAGEFVQILTDQTPGLRSYQVYARDMSDRLSDTVSVNTNVQEHSQNEVSVFLPPTLQLSQIEVNRGDDVTISGATSPGASVVLYIDEVYFIIAAGPNGEWSYDLSTSQLAVGEQQIHAMTVKSGGQQSYPTRQHTLIINASLTEEEPTPTAPPSTPTVDNPKPGTVIQGNTVTISGRSQPFAQIEVWNRDRLIGSVFADENGFWSITLTLSDYDNELRVRACLGGVCSEFSSGIPIFLARPPTPEALSLSLNRYRLQVSPGELVSIRATAAGGSQPYVFSVDWGSGEKDALPSSQGLALFSHRYLQEGRFDGSVTVTDSSKSRSVAHFSVLVKSLKPPGSIWPKVIVGGTFAVTLYLTTIFWQPICEAAIKLKWPRFWKH